jgi:hypothetical protein
MNATPKTFALGDRYQAAEAALDHARSATSQFAAALRSLNQSRRVCSYRPVADALDAEHAMTMKAHELLTFIGFELGYPRHVEEAHLLQLAQRHAQTACQQFNAAASIMCKVFGYRRTQIQVHSPADLENLCVREWRIVKGDVAGRLAAAAAKANS